MSSLSSSLRTFVSTTAVSAKNPWAPARTAAAGGPVPVWWLSPVALILGFVLPIFFVITGIGLMDSDALTIRTARYVTLPYILLGSGLLLAMTLGAWLGQQVKPRSARTPFNRLNWAPALWFLGLIALGAYLYWFRVILFSPSTLFSVLTGGSKPSRAEIGVEVGLTSLVNFCPIFFALFSHAWVRARCEVSGPLKILALALFLLTLFRVYVWSERLAFIEIATALFVPLGYAYVQRNPDRLFSRIFRFGPYAALPLLFIYFGVWEYFRSWQAEIYNGRMSFLEFVAGRLASYYYTSLNNGAGMLALYDWPTYDFQFTMEWMHRAPFMVGPIFKYLIQENGNWFSWFLQANGDPEFNNPSGIYSVVYDMGIALGLVYFVAIGWVCGVAYRCFLSAKVFGIIIFPLTLITIVEIYRYPYFGSTRSFTVVLGALISVAILYANPSRRLSRIGNLWATK